MMVKLKLFITLFCLHFTNIDCARILAVFPTASISHQVVFRSLIDGLVKRNHEVTVITTDPAYPAGQAPVNLKEIDVHDLSYNLWRNLLEKEAIGSRDDYYNQVNNIIRAATKVFMEQLKHKEIEDIINNRTEEFDLLILEAWVQPTLIFTHLFKVPAIHISSMSVIDSHLRSLGVPTHPLLYPPQQHQRIYNLTKWEKIQALYGNMWFEWNLAQLTKEDDELLKTVFGKNTPSINELSRNIDMLLVNIQPIWIDNQPLPPNIVCIGGLHTKPAKQLPKDLQNYLDSSKNGVIYFSLGTNANPSLLPQEKIQTLLKVFSQLPYDVMWKWNEDELPGRTKNIKIFKWVPQSDLLRHPNIKLFVTQGGMQSTDEAINAEVPLIGIPMLADQWYNVEKYVHHKIGLRLDLETLTENNLKTAIDTVINDKSFRENISRLRKIMEDQPQPPLERAVWWTEYVLRHGGAKHLRAAGANITWAEYLEIEIFLILAVFFITIVISVIFLILHILRLFRYNTKIKLS